MAKVFPADWNASTFMHEGEKETIEWLQDALSDEYVIWAGVEYASREKSGVPVYGEIDFLVVGPSGNVVLIEQKNGWLSIDEHGELTKSYRERTKSVGKQLRHSFSAFLKQWDDAYGRDDTRPHLTTMMLLPDFTVENLASLQIDRIQLVDKPRLKDLPQIIEEILAHSPPNERKFSRMMEFLDGQLSLAADIGAALENQDKVYRNFGSRLSRFVDTLTFAPRRLHVQGCAGSGKTQLAVSFYARALKEGRRPLYVCFNRPLADRLAHILPRVLPPAAGHGGVVAAGQPASQDARHGVVATVDRLTELYCGETSAAAESYQKMDERFREQRARALETPVNPAWQFDTVIVDEGQDFSAQQAAFVEMLLVPGGELLWMADTRQQLYARDDTAALDTTLRMDLRENFRCGRAIVDYTNTLLALNPPDIAAGATQGEMPQLIVLAEGENVVACVEKEIERLIGAGYEAADTAVISGMGRERSQLVKQAQLAGWHTRRFEGYDNAGNQCYTQGLLRVDTVYRFKGLQAAAVIFAEIDTGEITPAVLNRLYTGMTRARSSLTLIVSARTRDLLFARMS